MIPEGTVTIGLVSIVGVVAACAVGIAVYFHGLVAAAKEAADAAIGVARGDMQIAMASVRRDFTAAVDAVEKDVGILRVHVAENYATKQGAGAAVDRASAEIKVLIEQALTRLGRIEDRLMDGATGR